MTNRNSTDLVRPTVAPDAASESAWRDYALAYLSRHFGAHAPATLGAPKLFARSPLEGDGAALVFPFEAAPGGHERQSFYVVVGRTEPNYFPAWGLAPEEVYGVHVGTRFMLTLQVAQVKPEDAPPYDAVGDVRRLVAMVAPQVLVESVEIAALFHAASEWHAVCRADVGGESVYVFARDCPPGFSRRTDLAPHVAYRMHLGMMLQQEADAEARAESIRRTQEARAAEARTPKM